MSTLKLDGKTAGLEQFVVDYLDKVTKKSWVFDDNVKDLSRVKKFQVV